MHEVASSTHSHAAHARPHAGHHAKAQSESDFAAMLDEMAPPKSDTPPDASTPVQGQAPATEQTAQTVVKTADTDPPAQVVTPALLSAPVPFPASAAGAPDADRELKTACLDLTNPAPTNPKLPEKQDLLSTGQPKAEDQSDGGDKILPTVTDKPVLPAASASQPANTAATIVPSPIAAPAQPVPTVVPVQQQAKPGDDTLLAPGIAPSIAGAPNQPVPGAKSAKPNPAPAELTSDDQPQGVAAPTPEQAALSLDAVKPAIPVATALTADKASAPRSSLELASTKTGAAQTFDDLLNAPTGQTNAAASSGSATAAANQTTAPAAAPANAPPPQAQLAPVPLSGIPVLIAGRALAGSNHFDIRLDPPELGRIEVRLKVDRDGQVSSHLIADRADTLALLRRDQTGLERALQDAGLKTNGDGLQFSLRDQGGNGQPNGRSAASTLLVQDNSNPSPDLLPRGYVSYAARIGGVDIHV